MALFRYLAVGMVNTLVGLLTIYSCKWLAGIGDVSANMIGYGVGILVGFQLNRNWTFDHQGSYWPSLLRYVTVLASAYVANLATVMYLINSLNLNSYLAQALGIGPYTLIGFLGSRYFAFPKHEVETL